MAAKNPFHFLSDETNKGAALRTLAQGSVAGKLAQTVLTFTGVIVDRDTLTIDGDVFELVNISTDSTFDALTDFNNTTNPVVGVSRTAHGLSVGDYIAIDTEIMKVTHVPDANTFSVVRGQAGTTIAAHATGTSAIEIKEATALTAGAITVPVLDLTADEALSRIEAMVTASSTQNWEAVKLSATVALIRSTVLGNRAAVCAETLTNATIITPTYNGSDASVSPVYTEARVPTADEVTAGNIYVSCPFTPSAVVTSVLVTATQAIKAWDGAVSYGNNADGVVTLDNTGTTDWAATDTITVVCFGAPVTVANATVRDYH